MKKLHLIIALVLCAIFVLQACKTTGETPGETPEKTPETTSATTSAPTSETPPATSPEGLDLIGLVAPPADPKTEITYAVFSFPKTLDPYYYTGAEGFAMYANIYDSLMFAYKGNTRDIRPLLAESLTKSDDGLVYTFKIREGVKFHNGDPVTVDDVLYSYTRWREAPNSKIAAEVVSDVVADYANNSVIITVVTPVPSAILQFAISTPIIPESVFGPNGSPDETGSLDPMAAVGCGAYRVIDFVQDQWIVLEAVDNYYLEDVYLGGNPIWTRKITYRYIPDQNARMAAFLTGEVVSIPDPTAEDVAYYDAIERENAEKGVWSPIRLSLVDSAWRHGLACNMADPIVGANDGTPEEQERALNLRRAMACAIDREALNLAEYNGYADDTIRQMIHPLTEGWLSDMPVYYPYNVEKAKEYFALTGYDKDPNFKLTLKYMTDDAWSVAFATVIEDCFRKAGITMELEGKTTGAHNEDVWGMPRGYQIAYMPYQITVGSPDTAFRSPFYSTSGWNPFNHANAKVDQLIDAARVELDTAKRVKMYEDANVLITESLAFIPLLGSKSQTLISERWYGYFMSVTTPYPKLFMMWWEDDGVWEANDGLPYLNGSDLTTYKVEHYKPNADGTWPSAPTDVLTYKGLNDGFGVTSARANLYDGYVLDLYESEFSLPINPDGSTVARYFYRPAE